MSVTAPSGSMAPAMKVRRHPIMGFFGGLLLGLGVAVMLTIYGVIPIAWYWLVGLVVVGAALGVLLAYVAPVRHRTVPG